MSGKLQTLKTITDDMKTDDKLKNDTELLKKSVDFLVNTLQSNMSLNMRNGSVIIERPRGNESMQTQIIDQATFETIAAITGDLLKTAEGKSDMKNEKKMAVAALLDAALQVSGNMMPDEQMNMSVDGI